jgi:hypothetical protein
MNDLKNWSEELTLELSIHSPSDAKRLSFGHRSGQLVYPHLEDEDCSYREYEEAMRKQTRNLAKRSIFWHSRLVEAVTSFGVEPIRKSKQRALGDLLHLDFTDFKPRHVKELPSCPAVNSFLVRRQHGRRLHYTALISILEKLPKVAQIMYEPWSRYKRRASWGKWKDRFSSFFFFPFILFYFIFLTRSRKKKNEDVYLQKV